MEYPFDELHAGIGSQIMNLPAGIPDSEPFPGSFVIGKPLMPIRRG